MEVPGLGSVNNSIRLDPARVTTPEVNPGKIAEKAAPQTSPLQPPLTLPNQAPAKPLLTQNQQAFSNLLMEMGIPNTLQNNQVAQVLANYGQPINKQTMSQVTQAMGPLIQSGPANIEAAVVLLINNMPINKQSVDAVRQLLTSGGLLQNLLGFSKDLQKMVQNFSNNNIPGQFSPQGQGQLISPAIMTNNQLLSSPAAQQLSGQASVITSKDAVESAKPDSTAIKIQEGKVEEVKAAIKNPYGSEAEEDIAHRNTKEPAENTLTGSKTGIGPVKTMLQPTNLIKTGAEEIQLIPMSNESQGIINQLSAKAQQINKNIISLLTIDILKNPGQFPQQIAMLRKCFSELEIDIKDFKELIRKNFPGAIEEEGAEENIFTDLLKLVLHEEEPDKLKKLKDPKSLKNDSASEPGSLIKDIARAAEAIDQNLLGREMLTKAIDCMCLPLSVPFNGKLYQVEIMITREDQSSKKTDVGQVPLKIKLAVETKNMGKVGVDISNLKRDLQICLAVENKAVQKQVQSSLDKLQTSLQPLPFDLSPLQCIVNLRPDENPSILLPQKYKVMSMRRIEGIV